MEALEQTTDAELLARSRVGDHSAFSHLVDRYKHSMVNYLTRLTGDRDRAEELAQETFVRFYSCQDQYSEQGRLSAYLYRIATNLLRSQLRHERRWLLLQPVFSSSNGRLQAASQQTEVLEKELGTKLQEALAELPLSHRVPVVLHELEEWPYREIAALLEVKEGTVKSRIHRARLMLKEKLEDYWSGGAR